MDKKRSSVNTPSAQAQLDRQRRDLPQTLAKGVEAMRAAAREYRYMFPRKADLVTIDLGRGSNASGIAPSSTTLYDLKVEQAVLNNVWMDGVRECIGEVFSHGFEFEGLPVEMEDGKGCGWLGKVDGARSIDEYMNAAFRRALISGIDWVWIDLPRLPIGRSLADEVVRRARPYWIEVKADQVLEAVPTFRDGNAHLGEIRFAYTELPERDPNDPWAVREPEERVMRFVAGDPDAPIGSDERKVRWQRYRKAKRDEDGDQLGGPGWRLDDEGFILGQGAELLDIPMVPVYTGYIEPFRAEPPLLDSAELQASHWRKQSDHDHRARVAAVPMLFQSGIDRDSDGEQSGGTPQGGGMSVEGMLWSEDPAADAKMVETSGAALGHLAEDLDRVEKQIRKANLQPLMTKPEGTVTATEIGLHQARASSQLEAWVKMMKASVRRAIEITAILGGVNVDGFELEFPSDFGINRSVDLEFFRDLYAEDLMSAEGFWDVVKKGGSLPDDFDADREIAYARSRTADRSDFGDLGAVDDEEEAA